MTNAFRILIIEDDEHIATFISKTLRSHGYKVSIEATGKEGISMISSSCPDIVLLDLGLPDMDGSQIITCIRAWSSCPIIVVSARNQEADKVHALDMGADDYITKPFGTSELMARIRTSIRHSNRLQNDSYIYLRPYEAANLKIDFIKHIVTLEGKDVHLTPVEYKIVALLAQNSGKVLTYSTIMQNVWGPYIDEDNKILRVNMANIRRKLEKNPAAPQYIFTEVGIGYRMLDG